MSGTDDGWTRRQFARLTGAAGLGLLFPRNPVAADKTAPDAPLPLHLWFAQPAAKWTEALPVGNGRIGATVFGGIGDERIQFNEATLWKGKPHNYVRAGAREHLEEIRQLIA